MIFFDRKHAGQLLAQRFSGTDGVNCVVLALPRGGVPVAEEIARMIGAPLDVLIVRKIGAPFQSELAVGAICEDTSPLWNDNLLYRIGLDPDDLNRTVATEREKIKTQMRLFREARKLPSVAGKTVIVVDDGLATGATMFAAVKYLKKTRAAKIIVAVPVGAPISLAKLRSRVDEIVVLQSPEDLHSVGEWYRDFSQVSDEEVVKILEKNVSFSKKTVREVSIPLDHVKLMGDLVTFNSMKALIIFAHGSGSSRKSTRNRQVANYLNDKGFGTLLFDLLTDQEAGDRRNVFNIDLLGGRLASVARWMRKQPESASVPMGFFGASTGAGAALNAAARLSARNAAYAIVSRGGRPDLAGEALMTVRAPTLLLVGGDDVGVIELNQRAQQLLVDCKLSIIPGATHLFEEPGKLEEVARQAADWFQEHLPNKKYNFRARTPSKLENGNDDFPFIE